VLLEVKDLTVNYYTAMILNEVSLRIAAHELVSLVGPNGAGKTTLLRAIAGLTRWERDAMKGMRAALSSILTRGEVRFAGERIDHLPAHEIPRKGLIVCPERARPFRELSVADNLKAGAYFWPKDMNKNQEKVYDLFPVLKNRKDQVAGTLSGGERVMLAIGRSLMSNPRLLCVDEPSTGIAPKAKEELFKKIEEIRGLGVNVMLIEQDVSFAFALSSRNYVMSKGKIISEGTAEQLLSNEKIRKIYLGL
jgi:branched-chain amino acid transport system ATP-binding protein